jgi:hypothetical protein
VALLVDKMNSKYVETVLLVNKREMSFSEGFGKVEILLGVLI